MLENQQRIFIATGILKLPDEPTGNLSCRPLAAPELAKLVVTEKKGEASQPRQPVLTGRTATLEDGVQEGNVGNAAIGKSDR
jgi:hypothetical protein